MKIFNETIYYNACKMKDDTIYVSSCGNGDGGNGDGGNGNDGNGKQAIGMAGVPVQTLGGGTGVEESRTQEVCEQSDTGGGGREGSGKWGWRGSGAVRATRHQMGGTAWTM